MKKLSLFLLIIIALSTISSLEVPDKSLARAKRIEGIYVFIASEPVNDYEVLGGINDVAIGSTRVEKVIERMAKKAKTDYPDADAVLFDKPSHTKATAIKFK